MDRPGRVLRQLLIAALVAAAVVVCLRLGWWQWQRFHSGGGSLQNLGYTLQWPTFAAFAVFMWWRLSKLERQRREQQAAEQRSTEQQATGQQAAGQQVAARAAEPVTEPATPSAPSGPHVDPGGEPDDELAAYNRFLAQLHAKERHRAR